MTQIVIFFSIHCPSTLILSPRIVYVEIDGDEKEMNVFADEKVLEELDGQFYYLDLEYS